jgi:hypothetical protein
VVAVDSPNTEGCTIELVDGGCTVTAGTVLINGAVVDMVLDGATIGSTAVGDGKTGIA